jgi:hypothetical protein
MRCTEVDDEVERGGEMRWIDEERGGWMRREEGG